MGYENVLEYQERLVRDYKYRPLPTLQRDEARAFYKENIPDGFCLDGARVPVFSRDGLRIADGYNRIVIGDYGAMVEMLPEQMVHENIRTKPGQEYRDENPRYSGSVTFSWLTARDDSDVKIQFQKKGVAHADMAPGRYYVSVYECVPAMVAEKDGVSDVSREDISRWLKEHGVFSEELTDYYWGKVDSYGDVIDCAVQHNVAPYELEYWLCIHDVCQVPEGLSFEQYGAISYNLSLIHCNGSELKGTLDSLTSDVRIAIEMGMEGLEFPYGIQNIPPESVRALLRLPAEDLLCVSKFSKVVAGQKAEEQLHAVDGLIKAASERVQDRGSQQTEHELVI